MASSRASSVRAGGGVPSLTASAIVAPALSGSHILRIDGYSRIKGLGNGKFIKSETFAIGGHSWHLTYYPGGDLSQDADSIFIFLQLDGSVAAGEVNAEFKISLLDQDGSPVPSYSTTSPQCVFSRDCPSMGYELVKRVDLERSVYLRNDVFSVRCDVTVAKEIFTQAIPVPTVYPGSVRGRGSARSRLELASAFHETL